MADLRTQPLTAERGAYRVEPYARPSSDPSLATLPKSVARSAGVGSNETPGFDSATASIDVPKDADFELTPEEVGHLQNSAANGDKESWDLLNALKLPLGIAAGAAALYGTARGGTALLDAHMRANGQARFGDQSRNSVGAKAEPQRLLPAPNKMGVPQPVQTGPDLSTPQAFPTDQRSIYEKTGGKLPTGVKAGEMLREAAKAVRRMH